jgi:hypothetical protein
MKNDYVLKNLFSLAKQSNRLVFELVDAFGDRLTIEELEYWMVYNVIASAEVNSVNIKELGFEDAVDEIDRKIKEKQSRWKKK